ncbi:competence protein CoiA family protein [Streptomyces parvus]|uniref:competence protein CoiA family protein n=1 Tax=Streptomyces parvus TaxID=66428 RepID=UPI003668F542
MPYDKRSAGELRDLHGRDAYCCGVLLGGCGEILTLRASAEKKSHFAHRPPATCQRISAGEDSADHLYIGEALREWLASLGQKPAKSEYIQQRSGPWDAVRVRFGKAGEQRAVHVQMAGMAYKDWEEFAAQDVKQTNVLRAYGPDSGLPVHECRLSDYALRFACETRQGTRAVLIGTQFLVVPAGEHMVE